jgi:hypothetical protein
LLGNGSVNRPATYEHATIEGRPLLGNGSVKKARDIRARYNRRPSFARQWSGKPAGNLLKMGFSMGSVSRLYNEVRIVPVEWSRIQVVSVRSCVDAGSNTSTVALWRRKGNPVSGCITGSPCSWGIYMLGPGPPGWGSLKSETVKYGHEGTGT